MKDVVVVGGGPSGMISAIEAAKNGNTVSLYEKNEKLGKKIYITGKGRCNLTNSCDEEEFLQNIPTNPYFMYSSIYTFNPEALMQYFESLSVRLKVERGNRVFPITEKASDITRALEKELQKRKVKLHFNSEVEGLLEEAGKIKGIKLKNNEQIKADAVIVATGGLSYPTTGATGDGYRFAEDLGHKVIAQYPSLVPLLSNDDWVKELQGVSLKNIRMRLLKGNKEIYNGFGEMLFTHEGISGPLVLTASKHYAGIDGEVIAEIDLKPALDDKELDKRILKDFEEYKNKSFKNSLSDLLPQKLIPVIVEKSKIDMDKRVNEITKIERKNLVSLLKGLKINIEKTAGFKQAVITTGGVSVSEIDPATMESKKIKGLYFVGEVIDVDGYTGGFNLQVAFSTGYLCGIGIK